jgi:hypothetical protein
MNGAYIVLDLDRWSLWCRVCPWRGTAESLPLVLEAHEQHVCLVQLEALSQVEGPVCYPVRLHRCFCCGRLGLHGFRPAGRPRPLAWVRTWVCVDQAACQGRAGCSSG